MLGMSSEELIAKLVSDPVFRHETYGESSGGGKPIEVSYLCADLNLELASPFRGNDGWSLNKITHTSKRSNGDPTEEAFRRKHSFTYLVKHDLILIPGNLQFYTLVDRNGNPVSSRSYSDIDYHLRRVKPEELRNLSCFEILEAGSIMKVSEAINLGYPGNHREWKAAKIVDFAGSHGLGAVLERYF